MCQSPGAQLAQNITKFAKTVWFSSKRGRMFLPKWLFGRPVDQSFFRTRMFNALPRMLKGIIFKAVVTFMCRKHEDLGLQVCLYVVLCCCVLLLCCCCVVELVVLLLLCVCMRASMLM